MVLSPRRLKRMGDASPRIRCHFFVGQSRENLRENRRTFDGPGQSLKLKQSMAVIGRQSRCEHHRPKWSITRFLATMALWTPLPFPLRLEHPLSDKFKIPSGSETILQLSFTKSQDLRAWNSPYFDVIGKSSHQCKDIGNSSTLSENKILSV